MALLGLSLFFVGAASELSYRSQSQILRRGLDLSLQGAANSWGQVFRELAELRHWGPELDKLTLLKRLEELGGGVTLGALESERTENLGSGRFLIHWPIEVRENSDAPIKGGGVRVIFQPRLRRFFTPPLRWALVDQQGTAVEVSGSDHRSLDPNRLKMLSGKKPAPGVAIFSSQPLAQTDWVLLGWIPSDDLVVLPPSFWGFLISALGFIFFLSASVVWQLEKKTRCLGEAIEGVVVALSSRQKAPYVHTAGFEGSTWGRIAARLNQINEKLNTGETGEKLVLELRRLQEIGQDFLTQVVPFAGCSSELDFKSQRPRPFAIDDDVSQWCFAQQFGSYEMMAVGQLNVEGFRACMLKMCLQAASQSYSAMILSDPARFPHVGEWASILDRVLQESFGGELGFEGSLFRLDLRSGEMELSQHGSLYHFPYRVAVEGQVVRRTGPLEFAASQTAGMLGLSKVRGDSTIHLRLLPGQSIAWGGGDRPLSTLSISADLKLSEPVGDLGGLG